MNCEGHYFNWSEKVAVYLRLHSSSQCKLSGMFVNLVPPVTVAFDDLFHFDFTVKPRRQNMYYFLRIEVVAFDLEHPEVCQLSHGRLAILVFFQLCWQENSAIGYTDYSDKKSIGLLCLPGISQGQCRAASS